MRAKIAAAILLLALLHNVSALYFYVTEGQHRCFLEEVPKDTLIVAHYQNNDLIDAANGQEAQVRCNTVPPCESS